MTKQGDSKGIGQGHFSQLTASPVIQVVLPRSRPQRLSGCGYNSIQSADEGTKQAWAEVVNQYQRRADLIPNLVNTVKGYAQQEKDVLTQVTEARSRVGQIQVNPGDTGSLKQFEAAQADMGSALSRLLVVAENYPQLKSDQNFRELQAELAGTENRITVARKRYIDAVNALQRDDPPVPGQPDGDGVRLRPEAAVQRRERARDLQASDGRLRHSRARSPSDAEQEGAISADAPAAGPRAAARQPAARASARRRTCSRSRR